MIAAALLLVLAQDIRVTATPQSQKTTRAIYGNVNEMSTWELRVCSQVQRVAVVPIERVFMALPKGRFMSAGSALDLLKVKREERSSYRWAKVLVFAVEVGTIVTTRGQVSLDVAHGFAIGSPIVGNLADGLRQKATVFDATRLLPNRILLERAECVSGTAFSNDPRPKVETLEASFDLPGASQ